MKWIVDNSLSTLVRDWRVQRVREQGRPSVTSDSHLSPAGAVSARHTRGYANNSTATRTPSPPRWHCPTSATRPSRLQIRSLIDMPLTCATTVFPTRYYATFDSYPNPPIVVLVFLDNVQLLMSQSVQERVLKILNMHPYLNGPCLGVVGRVNAIGWHPSPRSRCTVGA